MPSLVCHLFAQFSMNASTSDCASASFSDSAFNRFLKSKTNGSLWSLKYDGDDGDDDADADD